MYETNYVVDEDFPVGYVAGILDLVGVNPKTNDSFYSLAPEETVAELLKLQTSLGDLYSTKYTEN